MTVSNIFEWIGFLFTDVLFLPFKWIRLTLANQDYGWWLSNLPNYGFLLILLVLFAYWMKQSKQFLDEGTEDRA